MKKITLLAASVAVALTGCGGGSSSSDGAAPNGVTITGFDGYFNQAVVFDDKNKNGVLDINSDIILGLTDSEGKLSLSDDEFRSVTSLALQTLTPGGAKQAALIASNPQLFAGKYTIDMDHPTQAMEHEVVFRTLPGEDVISPLTDLVVLEAGANPTDADITEAKKTVNVSLGLPENSEDAFGDVIANDNAELHKTAQILTESKANDPAGYEANPTGVAEEATEVVEDNLDKIDDENFKPIVDGNPTTEPVINTKLVVSKDAKDHLNAQADKLELTTHEDLDISLPLSFEETALFSDADNNDIVINASITTKMQEIITGVTLTAVNGGDLVVTGTPSLIRDTYIVTLAAEDKDSTNKVVGSATTTLELEVDLENDAPSVIADKKIEIQSWFDELELAQGVAPSLDYVIISDLFNDKDVLAYDAYTSVNGLEIFIDDQSQVGADATLQLLKAPTYAYPAGESVTITAYDGVNTTYVTFTLPEIQEQNIKADPEEVAELQKYITQLLSNMKVGEEIDVHSIAIDELFEDDYVSGSVEYYVGLENDQEGATSIPGVKVAIENDVYLKLSGTPTKAVTNGHFIMMAGVNVDNDGEIISEPVSFSLPTVAPSDEVTPPVDPDLHPLVGKPLYFVETPESDDKVKLNRCETFYLNDGKVYFGSESYSGDVNTSCAPVSDTASATYSIEGDVITILEDDYAPMTLEVKHTSKLGTSSRFTVTSVEKEDEGDDFGTFEAMTSKAETESRLNSVSTGSWDNVAQLTTLFINGEYVELYITPQMQNKGDGGNDGIADADLFIDNPNGDITCADLQNSFDAGFFGEQWASFTEGDNCWTNTEKYKYVTLDFDYKTNFANPSSHRIHLMGLTDQLPSFNMNIKYIGDSSYE
ncbi:hypothetical protein QWY97_09550 [Vibrio cortegadensis]|uniref:hypothetical protein n=1 Tax=Vibrio cortegadensis TaxID=1328770 RepID=UPI0021C3C642|nr:hypothetical protein [Vibrio cortegadensis]MDN3697586.1 hypothetical protein [Vibrio cortegadensis]